MKTGENMITEGHVDEPEKLEKELTDLKLRWEALCTMSVTKQERLMNSLVLSKEMQSGSQALVRRLIELEDVLKKQGPIADEIAPLRNQIDEFQVRFISIFVCKLILGPDFEGEILSLYMEVFNPGMRFAATFQISFPIVKTDQYFHYTSASEARK